MITPFGVAGALQLKIIEVEFSAIPKNRRGGPAGTVQHIMSVITVVSYSKQCTHCLHH